VCRRGGDFSFGKLLITVAVLLGFIYWVLFTDALFVVTDTE
jgi:hypothetical protein